MPIDWKKISPSKEDFETIAAIAARAMEGVGRRKEMDIIMDLEVVHASTPLRLEALLAADDFDFHHDVGGIARHLNRSTGELEGCFVPRFARRVLIAEEGAA